MKKLAVILSVIIIVISLNTTAFAQTDIPVSAQMSETADGEIRVVIYAHNIEKLVSLFTVLEYDTQLYELKEGAASGTPSAEGEKTDNFPGVWVFGTLADGSGCVGAFVSHTGVSKTAKTAVCEFVLGAKTSRKSANDIKIYVKEFITDDNDEENDIYKKTPVGFKETDTDDTNNFEYSIQESVTVTSIKTQDEVVFIPENIEGVTVRSLDFKEPSQTPFTVFGRNVLNVGENVFTSESFAVAPVNSAPVAAVTSAGGMFLGYNESVIPDLEEQYLYTDKYLVNKSNMLFESNADYTVTPSHNTLRFWGTGTVVELKNGESTADFLLCVKGDINGDSVCDVLDVMISERYINELDFLSDIEQKGAEFNEDNTVNLQDYTQIVNQSLDGGYKIFDGIRGDFNGDYCVDALDIFAFNKMMKKEDISQLEKAKADLNNDGKIDTTDKIILETLIETFN
ncbi:MAG: dockerin type I repeat-containing protein [Clostridia bacterium]|nr:dockerin type I repeat-containing protein [Clostridia bacterium]